MIKLKIYDAYSLAGAIIYECPKCKAKCSTMTSWKCRECGTYVPNLSEFPTEKEERLNFFLYGKNLRSISHT
jgi:tRNA(Ile2) C34 agmatinyltransferase TiaS